MKNIVVYYFAIVLPLVGLLMLAGTGHSGWFALGMLAYAFPYRVLIDGMRLVSKRMLRWNQLWKLLIPWNHYEYWKPLYFQK